MNISPKMRNGILVVFIVFILFAVLYYVRYPLRSKVTFISDSQQGVVKIHENSIAVEMAVTTAEKHLGLGNRDSMPLDHGMLFVFQSREQHGFVMRDMRFPLDFIWIDGIKIVDITHEVPVDTTLPLKSYQPKFPVDKVLEVNAGTAKRLNISIGDSIQITQ